MTNLAPSHIQILLQIMRDLQTKQSSLNSPVITIRDLFKWANRTHTTLEDLAVHGYLLLGERMRSKSERDFVKQIIEHRCRVKLDIENFLDTSANQHLSNLFCLPTSLLQEFGISSVGFTRTLQRQASVIHICLSHKEAVLLVGETGRAKTTICKLLALAMHVNLFQINVHESGSF